MTKRSKTRAWIRLAIMTIVPIVLLILPSDFFDEGQAMCISKVLLDMECPGCGMSRAAMHLIHFNFVEAWYFNPLVYIVFPLLAFLWGREMWRDYQIVKA